MAQMNEHLCKYISEAEIADTLDPIGPPKSRDCTASRSFFSNQSCDQVKQCFATGIMPDGVNSTTIALIPKAYNLTKLTEFLPISLCNVVSIFSQVSSQSFAAPYLGDN